MLKKIVLLALSLLLIVSVFAVTACGGSDSSTSSASKSVAVKDVVPQKANLVARISLESILADKDISDLYDKLAGAGALTLEDPLGIFQGKNGLDFKDFKEITLFGDITNPNEIFSEQGITSTRDYLGCIISGTFKNDQLIAAIEKGMGHKLEFEAYEGREVYADEEGNRLTFLSDGVFVGGSAEAVKDVIDVKKGVEQGLSGELLNLYDGLGNPQAKLAMEIPAEWLTQIPDERDVLGVGKVQLNVFKDMRMATLVADRAGNAAVIEIKVDFYTSSSANSAKQTIDGIINVVQGLMKMTAGQTDTQINPVLAKLLDSFKLSVSGNWLTLHLEITAEQIEELMPMLQSIISEEW